MKKPKHTCAFCREHDPDTLQPVGPQCGKRAVQEIFWMDGRVSPSCSKHGYEALEPDAQKLVVHVSTPQSDSDWETMG